MDKDVSDAIEKEIDSTKDPLRGNIRHVTDGLSNTYTYFKVYPKLK